ARSGAGGFVIKRPGDGLCLGGVGVSGASTVERDEAIGRACIQAMGV
ncbi:MAG: heme-binding protein, partial [Chloroflexi bacterium]|nr:heme-binding protein [Chloroflexota bacterium]